MTGCLKTKKTSSGKELYYIRLVYKDSHTMEWKTKDISTGLTVKGNKLKAEGLIKEYLEKYAYLERLSIENTDIDPSIELCDFLDLWMSEKECDICGNTCASLLIDKGWDVKKIQYWLGDADAETVMNIYAHYMRQKANLAENDLTEMTRNVSDLFE